MRPCGDKTCFFSFDAPRHITDSFIYGLLVQDTGGALKGLACFFLLLGVDGRGLRFYFPVAESNYVVLCMYSSKCDTLLLHVSTFLFGSRSYRDV